MMLLTSTCIKVHHWSVNHEFTVPDFDNSKGLDVKENTHSTSGFLHPLKMTYYWD